MSLQVYNQRSFALNATKATNSSAWPYEPLDSKQGLILFLITLPGTLGNMVAFITTWKLIKTQVAAPNYLILALNFTDFYGIAFCTFPTLLCYLNKNWTGGDIMCNFQGVSTMFASLASGIFASVMATDRLLAIWKPYIYRQHVTVKKTLITICATWLIALFIGLLPLVGVGDFVRNLTGTFCTVNWFAKRPADQAYSIVYASIGIVLVVVVVICNIQITVSLFRIKRKRQEMVSAMRLTDATSRKTEMQLVKSVGAISVLFVICWFPFMVGWAYIFRLQYFYLFRNYTHVLKYLTRFAFQVVVCYLLVN